MAQYQPRKNLVLDYGGGMETLAAGVAGALIIGIGLGCVWLGGRGIAGRIDYAFGAYTREDSSPEAWRRAHELAGQAIRLSGWMFVIAGIAGVGLYVAGNEELSGPAFGGLCLVAVPVMLVGVFRGLAVLTNDHGARRGASH